MTFRDWELNLGDFLKIPPYFNWKDQRRPQSNTAVCVWVCQCASACECDWVCWCVRSACVFTCMWADLKYWVWTCGVCHVSPPDTLQWWISLLQGLPQGRCLMSSSGSAQSSAEGRHSAAGSGAALLGAGPAQRTFNSTVGAAVRDLRSLTLKKTFLS